MGDYSNITDIAFFNSYGKDKEAFLKLFNDNLFSDEKKWDDFRVDDEIPGIMDGIKARMKYFMSKLSLGVYNALDIGPGKNLKKEDEIYLISGFTEIGTINKIGNMIMENDYGINPSLFPNSVHHISLCYYTILKKISNYCAAITDGMDTNLSFINFIKNRVKINGDFVIVTGEENSPFFYYESNRPLKIVNSFAAYKIIPDSKSGFSYKGNVKSIEELKENDIFKKAGNIFADRETFFTLKNEKNKNLYCEYPIIKDNPCGIIFRLALPFYFDIKGYSIIIEKIENQYFIFEVNI